MKKLSGSQRRKNQRTRLYHEQKRKCCYCGRFMKLIDGPPDGFKDGVHDTCCTLEHLDERTSGRRSKFNGTERLRAACYKCNTLRNIRIQKANPQLFELMGAVKLFCKMASLHRFPDVVISNHGMTIERLDDVTIIRGKGPQVPETSPSRKVI